jgi:hypothetical protein
MAARPGPFPKRSLVLVVVTHHMYCQCLAALRAYGRPVTVVVTDLFGGPAEWFEPGADRYMVPTVHMRTAALRRGRCDREVLVRRLPTRLSSAAASGPRPARRPGARPRALVVGGADGAGPLRRVAGIPGIERSNARAIARLIGRSPVRSARAARRLLGAGPATALEPELPTDPLTLADVSPVAARESP